MHGTRAPLLGIISLAAYSAAWTIGAPINGGPELNFEVVSEKSFAVPFAEYEVIKGAPDGNVVLFSPKSKLIVTIPAAGSQPETILLAKILPDSGSRLQRLLPALAFDPGGKIYIAANLPGKKFPNYGVYVIDSGGAFVKMVELQNASEFREFAVDSGGRIYAPSPAQGPGALWCAQINQYEPNGRFVRSLRDCERSEPIMLPHFSYLGKRSTPLWVANDRIYYTPPKDDRLMVFGIDGILEETRYLSSPPVETALRNRGFLVTPDVPAEVISARPVGDKGLLLAWRRSGIPYVSFNAWHGAALSAALPASRMDGWPIACDRNGECDVVWQTSAEKVFIRRVRIVLR